MAVAASLYITSGGIFLWVTFCILPVAFIAKVSLVWGGFRLGFVHHSPRSTGSGLYQSAKILYHLTTAMGQGERRLQRFGVLYSKVGFAVQDMIKNPKLKPPNPQTLAR